MIWQKCKFVINMFSMITTCVVFAVAVFSTILNPGGEVSGNTMWQILLLSALTSLWPLIYPWNRAMKRMEIVIRTCIHYFLTLCTVLVAGYWFDWYNVEKAESVLSMITTITLIFVLLLVVSWSRCAKDVKRMNEKLQEYQSTSDE